MPSPSLDRRGNISFNSLNYAESCPRGLPLDRAPGIDNSPRPPRRHAKRTVSVKILGGVKVYAIRGFRWAATRVLAQAAFTAFLPISRATDSVRLPLTV